MPKPHIFAPTVTRIRYGQSMTTGSTTHEQPSGKSSFVVIANRLPFDLEVQEDGSTIARQAPGGLVTALAPMLTKQHGAWVGWPGQPDVTVAPTVSDNISLYPVRLDASEVADYYEGFSNGTLWPLYHDAVVGPDFHRQWWDVYKKVNQRFAAAAAEVAAPDAVVWVHDYQLQLVPAMLRELRPDVRIGFFLHIPFPPAELFMQLPQRDDIINGLLGADLVGFQLPGGARNFVRLARRLTGAATAGPMIEHDGRSVRAAAFPISIDSAGLAAAAADPATQAAAAQLREDLGNPRKLILGVDRLDYTKGINVRLRAFGELLAEEDPAVADTVMVQIATPSRERLESYAKMRDEIERQVGAINGDFGSIGRTPIFYLHQSLPREDLTAYYAAADVMVVTPLRDGMNLVAKEYVACRTNDDGALVLSEFAGAAHELRSSLLVNPYDLDGVKEALRQGLSMSAIDAGARMRALRQQVFAHDVDRWAETFLHTLNAHRERAATAAGRLPASVVRATRRISSADRLLVATDFDGTLAPIVADPAAARALPDSVAALHALADLPNTTVAIVSGRSIADLHTLLGDPGALYLIGSHGAERREPPGGDAGAGGSGGAGDSGGAGGSGGSGGAGGSGGSGGSAGAAQSGDQAPLLSRSESRTLRWLTGVVTELAEAHPGLRLEHKPVGITTHLRGMSAEAEAAAIDALNALAVGRSDVQLTYGKKVVEFSVVTADKGTALEALRGDIRATDVVFLGDDVTDENAFVTLASRDLGVKVGGGETAARLRVENPLAVSDLLGVLLSARGAWANREETRRRSGRHRRRR